MQHFGIFMGTPCFFSHILSSKTLRTHLNQLKVLERYNTTD